MAALERGCLFGSERKALPSLALIHATGQSLGWHQSTKFHQNRRGLWTDAKLEDSTFLLKDACSMCSRPVVVVQRAWCSASSRQAGGLLWAVGSPSHPEAGGTPRKGRPPCCPALALPGKRKEVAGRSLKSHQKRGPQHA